jgi:hypothetical protein
MGTLTVGFVEILAGVLKCENVILKSLQVTSKFYLFRKPQEVLLGTM